jgi:hypothetical protein
MGHRIYEANGPPSGYRRTRAVAEAVALTKAAEWEAMTVVHVRRRKMDAAEGMRRANEAIASWCARGDDDKDKESSDDPHAGKGQCITKGAVGIKRQDGEGQARYADVAYKSPLYFYFRLIVLKMYCLS